jgi:hypothetical protein
VDRIDERERHDRGDGDRRPDGPAPEPGDRRTGAVAGRRDRLLRPTRARDRPQDETTLVWGCIPLPPDGGRSPYDVLAASIRPAGGSFGVGAIVSPSDATASNPVVGVDTQGDTVLAYSVGGTVLGEVRPPAQAFGGPVTLDAGAPSLAVTAGDDVTLAWPGPGVGTTTLVDWVG